MAIFLAIIGTIFVVSGLAVLVWPGYQRIVEWDNEFTARHSWMKRIQENRRQELKRWESRPSRWWFIPLLAAIAVAALYTWLLITTDRNLFGPAWGGAIGLLLVYAFARRPGTTLSDESTRNRLLKWILLGGGVVLLLGGIAALAGAAGLIR